MNLQWDLTAKYYWNCPPNPTGWICPCPLLTNICFLKGTLKLLKKLHKKLSHLGKRKQQWWAPDQWALGSHTPQQPCHRHIPFPLTTIQTVSATLQASPLFSTHSFCESILFVRLEAVSSAWWDRNGRTSLTLDKTPVDYIRRVARVTNLVLYMENSGCHSAQVQTAKYPAELLSLSAN